ncbi:hypothetical protein OS493_035791 [Desmophyllum pertusum]|uniref:ATPase AAA-type core domain-containing protein n=1 Tax=Desmophyllum pertusum TaxID=174260 RepID=A0A9W9YIA9_9CNID|nr:hypothetical protein OS493_035791 [Desmophyllum pertusum]
MFGMTRDLGRKKQERRKSSNRLPKGAYTMDKRLVPRVKEVKHGKDTNQIWKNLLTIYRQDIVSILEEKRRAFKLSVEKVYDAISKDREEDKHLQELEERFLQKRKHSPDFRDLNDSNNNDDDSDDEKGSDDKSLELSSDSELSLGDEPLMEIQDTNMMNQSMQSMYKATSSHPTSEDEGDFEQATDPSKSNEKKDMFSPESGSLHMDQSHSASLNTSYQNEERSLSKMGTPDEPQLSMQDNKSLNNPELSSNNTPDLSGKRKRVSSGEGKKIGTTTPKKTKKSLQKNTKDKQAEDTDFKPAQSSIKFSDIGGCDDTVEQVCKLLVHMRHPEVFRTLGVTPPRGFLLHGPPGCGKTLLAHAIAGELEMPFIKIAATEIVSGVSGESEEKVRELFSRAVAHAPCCVIP